MARAGKRVLDVHLKVSGMTSSAMVAIIELSDGLLQETGVAILPGVEFGPPAEELTAPLASVDLDASRTLVAAESWPRGRPLNREFLRDCRQCMLPALPLTCDRVRNGPQEG